MHLEAGADARGVTGRSRPGGAHSLATVGSFTKPSVSYFSPPPGSPVGVLRPYFEALNRRLGPPPFSPRP